MLEDKQEKVEIVDNARATVLVCNEHLVKEKLSDKCHRKEQLNNFTSTELYIRNQALLTVPCFTIYTSLKSQIYVGLLQ